MLDQQRAIDEQRARDQVESSADLVAADIRGKLAEAGERLSGWLSNPSSPAPAIDGAVVVAGRPNGIDVNPPAVCRLFRLTPNPFGPVTCSRHSKQLSLVRIDPHVRLTVIARSPPITRLTFARVRCSDLAACCAGRVISRALSSRINSLPNSARCARNTYQRNWPVWMVSERAISQWRRRNRPTRLRRACWLDSIADDGVSLAAPRSSIAILSRSHGRRRGTSRLPLTTYGAKRMVGWRRAVSECSELIKRLRVSWCSGDRMALTVRRWPHRPIISSMSCQQRRSFGN